MKVKKAEKLKNGCEVVSGTLTENEAKAIMEITGAKNLNEAIKKYIDICTAKVG